MITPCSPTKAGSNLECDNIRVFEYLMGSCRVEKFYKCEFMQARAFHPYFRFGKPGGFPNIIAKHVGFSYTFGHDNIVKNPLSQCLQIRKLNQIKSGMDVA